MVLIFHDEPFDIDRILKTRKRKGNIQYLVSCKSNLTSRPVYASGYEWRKPGVTSAAPNSRDAKQRNRMINLDVADIDDDKLRLADIAHSLSRNRRYRI